MSIRVNVTPSDQRDRVRGRGPGESLLANLGEEESIKNRAAAGARDMLPVRQQGENGFRRVSDDMADVLTGAYGETLATSQR